MQTTTYNVRELTSLVEELARPSTLEDHAELDRILHRLPASLRASGRALAKWLRAVQQEPGRALSRLADTVDYSSMIDSQHEALLAAVVALDVVQHAFDDWANILDRQELLLGLRLLRHADVLTAPMREMLVFYFRASDPTLYQAAAQTLGAHLKQDPALYDFLSDYLQKRSLRIDQPIALNNIRSSRRVLVALSACVASPREVHPELQERPLPTMPLDLEESPVGKLFGSDLDLYLRALELLISAPDPHQRLAAHTATTVHQIARGEELPVTRLTLERWSSLVSVLHHHWPEMLDAKPSDLLQQRIHIQLRHLTGAEDFGPYVRQLSLLDTLLRLLVEWPDDVKREVVEALATRVAGEQRAVMMLRLQTWSRRLGVPFDASLPDFEEAPRFLQLARTAESAPVAPSENALTGSPYERQLREILALLCGPLATRHHWHAAPRAERALRAFLLLDYFRHGTLSEEALHAALAGAGVPVEQGASFYTILRRVLQYEGESADVLVDPHWLYQTHNRALLLSLIPPGRTSSLLYALADTLEHRLRQGLLSNPRFDFGSLLVGIAGRRPHASFWHYLKKIASERTYMTADGREARVHEVVDIFLAEASGAGVPEEAPSLSAAVFTASGSATLNAVQALRNRLLEFHEPADLLIRLKAFSTLLHSGTGETLDDLSSLIALRAGGHHPLATEGTHLPVAHELMALINDRGHTLLPARLDEAVAAIETARRTGALLEQISEHVADTLPYVERHLTRAVCHDLAGELEAWTATLDRIWIRWGETRHRPSKQLLETGEAIIEEVARLESPALQKHAFQMLWTSMQTLSPKQTTPWQHRFGLLAWGMQVFDETDATAGAALWQDLLAATWEELADEAMREGFESRLSRLVRTPAFRPLRRKMRGDDLLLRMKRWFMDCYRLGDVSHVQQWLKEASGFAVVRELPRFYTSFFIHFSAVWTALIIGAILMLDFGDAWTAMAEVGDIQGIVLTFILGTVGAFLYILTDLQQKVGNAPEDRVWDNRLSRLLRASLFLVGCLVFTLVITAFLWFLLSGTDEVVHGANAVLHVMVWTGFALFVGVFFGLLAKST